jgi:DNA polymerase-1
VKRVFEHIMMPCNKAFVDMEFEGAYVDIARMDEVETELKKRILAAKKNLDKWVPVSKRGDFNWGSPKQVAWLLYKKLKIECLEKTKTGADSTGESALKQIDHPLVDELFKFREAKQNLSFFIDGWKPYLVNKRLHASFKLTGTVTGRLSCEHPNFQQIPRDPLIRTLLTAPPGWVLIEADLSQIELRIAAELSGDSALIQAFVQGKDPHWITALRELQRGHGEEKRVLATANKLSNKEIEDYDEAIEYLIMRGADAATEADYAWKELRKKAKAVNFGYLYGMWWKKFIIYARDKYGVKITAGQAQESRKAFFGNWRDLENWHKRTKQFARRNGYVRYLSGRKRRLPDALSEEDNFKRQEAERQAVNSPVQGMANEINLMALIQLKKEFSSKVYRPIATVHDSILAYARIDHAERIARRTMEVMKRPSLMDKFDIQMRVPIEADVKIGAWGAGISLDKWLKEQKNVR